jgi:2-polyprenyl-3-methyl-5-hydroxy-6-metoxy-1,4-benzoquinol methylase
MASIKTHLFHQMSVRQVASYWNARPCNIRHSPKTIGTEEYFNEVEARKYFVEPHIPHFADFARWKGKRVLEIGCGIGTDTMNFARNGARITSVDLSEKSLEVARQRAKLFGLEDRITFAQANAEELTRYVAVEPYDLIYSFGVIHHTPHPERVLEQLRYYIKPGTMLKVMVYYRWSWKVLAILLSYGKGQFWKLDQLIARHSEAQTGCPVTYAYSRRQASRLLEHYRFSVRDVVVDHIFPYKISDYVQYKYTVVWYLRWIPRRAFRIMERMWGWHLCLTAIANPPASNVSH